MKPTVLAEIVAIQIAMRGVRELFAQRFAHTVGELVCTIAARQLATGLLEIEVVTAVALAPHDVLDLRVLAGLAADQHRDLLADRVPSDARGGHGF
jgi:hypothetical protein